MNESYAERGYAERGYARGRQNSTRTGGLIVAAVAGLSTVLVLLGLYYATGTTARHKAAMAAAGCEPNLMSVNVGCTTVQMLVSRYTSVTNPAVEQLNADVAAYAAAERHNLTAAETAVRAEVATADVLIESLARIPFPPFAAPEAKVTIQAIRARVKLMTEQARSPSLARLRSFNSRVDAAGTAVQTDLKLLTKAVGHHPTASQEPSGN